MKAFYEVFIQNKQGEKYAVSIVENIEGVVLYVVLNHQQATQKLIENLTDRLVETVGLISLNAIELEEPFVAQLYPNFENETWDYLFIPTVKGMLNYVDKYYDFTKQKVIQLNSKEEFIETFNIEYDEWKLIVSPLIR